MVVSPFDELPVEEPSLITPTPWYLAHGQLPADIAHPGKWTELSSVCRLQLALLLLLWVPDAPRKHWQQIVGPIASPWDWSSRVRLVTRTESRIR